MAAQLKQLAIFYDHSRLTGSFGGGATLVLPSDSQRISFHLGVSSGQDFEWATDGNAVYGFGHPFAVQDPILAQFKGLLEMKWADDYVLCQSEIWILDSAGMGNWVADIITYHPERKT